MPIILMITSIVRRSNNLQGSREKDCQKRSEIVMPSCAHLFHPTDRKRLLFTEAERLAGEIDYWRARNKYFHQEDVNYQRFLIPPGLRVLELGCGSGSLLAALRPSVGVGVDFSPAMITIARERHTDLEFQVGDIENVEVIRNLKDRSFDVLVISDTLGALDDLQHTFELLHQLCSRDTRVIVASHSSFWEPILVWAEQLGLKMPVLSRNWLSMDDIAAILRLAGFEEIKREWRQLVPKRLLGLGPLINRFIAPLPLIQRLCIRNYMVFRSLRQPPMPAQSATIVIPCRNERGNIIASVERMPHFAPEQEIIFVEGHSDDGTLDEIRRAIGAHPEMDIKLFVQDGEGKGDAVRKGFEMARGDILMILDADLTVGPEELTKFYAAITSGAAEFVNGTRMVYPKEGKSMRTLNLIANRILASLFTYILNQRFTDTLCGTKALSRKNYERLAVGRNYFGSFDPFGDFDLILGAVKLNLKVIEVPIRYRTRRFGETKISRFSHGWLLMRMLLFAFRRFKMVPE
jgi:SAM-dependent methyltransferase